MYRPIITAVTIVALSLLLLGIFQFSPSGKASQAVIPRAPSASEPSPSAPTSLPSTKTSHMFDGDVRLASMSGSSVSFAHSDLILSTTAATALDGTMSYSGHALPFGAPISTTGAYRYRYVAKESDATDLAYFNKRAYHPSVGRFVSADPVMELGAGMYPYVRNNPLTLTDPTGEVAPVVIGAAALLLRLAPYVPRVGLMLYAALQTPGSEEDMQALGEAVQEGNPPGILLGAGALFTPGPGHRGQQLAGEAIEEASTAVRRSGLRGLFRRLRGATDEAATVAQRIGSPHVLESAAGKSLLNFLGKGNDPAAIQKALQEQGTFAGVFKFGQSEIRATLELVTPEQGKPLFKVMVEGVTEAGGAAIGPRQNQDFYNFWKSIANLGLDTKKFTSETSYRVGSELRRVGESFTVPGS